jgi:hypothetical protein
MGDEEPYELQEVDHLAAECMRGSGPPPPEARPITPAPVERSRTWTVIAAVSVAVIVVQIPMLRASSAPKPSIRVGSYPTDQAADVCIDQLWQFSSLIREGLPESALKKLPITEPITNKSYVVHAVGREIVVECPNPSLHGVARIRVSGNAPIPEVIR